MFCPHSCVAIHPVILHSPAWHIHTFYKFQLQLSSFFIILWQLPLILWNDNMHPIATPLVYIHACITIYQNPLHAHLGFRHSFISSTILLDIQLYVIAVWSVLMHARCMDKFQKLAGQLTVRYLQCYTQLHACQQYTAVCH